MAEQQPDDLVTALADAIYDAHQGGYDDMARAVLARTDLVLPAADVVPRAEHLEVVQFVGSAVHALAETRRLKRAICELAEQWEVHLTTPARLPIVERFVSDLRALLEAS